MAPPPPQKKHAHPTAALLACAGQGDWRLQQMPRVMKALGHRYTLQMDDDSYIDGPIGEFMSKTGGWLAVWVMGAMFARAGRD